MSCFFRSKKITTNLWPLFSVLHSCLSGTIKWHDTCASKKGFLLISKKRGWRRCAYVTLKNGPSRVFSRFFGHGRYQGINKAWGYNGINFGICATPLFWFSAPEFVGRAGLYNIIRSEWLNRFINLQDVTQAYFVFQFWALTVTYNPDFQDLIE